MVDPSREEQRALSRDELELVSLARNPQLKDLDDGALADLVRRLRDRRDRARDLAAQQRREMRGKAEPAGVTAARDNGGSVSKEHFLGAALSRAEDERRRREGDGGHAQAEFSRDALALKRETGGDQPEVPAYRNADEGMEPIPNEGIAPSGAFDAEGHRPVVERTRKAR